MQPAPRRRGPERICGTWTMVRASAKHATRSPVRIVRSSNAGRHQAPVSRSGGEFEPTTSRRLLNARTRNGLREKVLRHEPRNRDAFLGLAAVAARAGRWDEAAEFYARILAFHPTDPIAQTALISIGASDEERRESRLKALLLEEPRAAYLHFALGNLYAEQSRWSEARLSYFNAHRFDVSNPDFAYNLAVSLDHLLERGSALDFYREALALAQGRSASFETAEATPDSGGSPAQRPQRPKSGRSTGIVR